MDRKHRTGFTLVELLVVVSIIALLIAILLPSLKKARAQAKQAVCATNLKQVGNGIWSYWTEYNGRIPYVISPMTNGGGPAPGGGTMPGFGDPNVADEDIDPFNRNAEETADEPKGWPMSLPNVLMPEYLGQAEKVFACPAAVNGWPRNGKPLRMTYRPAAANQLSGTPPTDEELGTGNHGYGDFDYIRDHLAFMDGRIYKPPTPVRKAPEGNIAEMMKNEMRRIALRGTFVRDMIKWRGTEEMVGPHNGGNNVINKRLEVENRSQKEINEDLAADNQRSVEF